jgi:hypothetical protein
MFHQVSGTGVRGSGETHKGDVWEHPQILGKFRGDGGGVPSIGVPVSKIIKNIYIY